MRRAVARPALGLRRETADGDALVTPSGLQRLCDERVGRGCTAAFARARKAFRNTRPGVKVRFTTSGECPGDAEPKPVVFPEPAAVAQRIGDATVVARATLICL